MEDLGLNPYWQSDRRLFLCTQEFHHPVVDASLQYFGNQREEGDGMVI